MSARTDGARAQPWAGPLITEEQRAEFNDRGFVLIEEALTPSLIDRLTRATNRVWMERWAGGPDRGASLHLKGFVTLDDAFLDLLDHPTTFPLVVGILGWNIFVYHCHLDVNPPAGTASTRRWGWHRDGERIDLDLAMRPAPMMSVKVAFFLTDVSEPDRGNLHVIPGSHRLNMEPLRVDGGSPPGAIPILARPGTAVLFDRRLWHARSENRSSVTRKALFLAYSYRWVRPREELFLPPAPQARLSPIRLQLLGAASGPMGHYVPSPEDVPVRELCGQESSSATGTTSRGTTA